MPISAGKLNRRITIQRATVTYDEFNNPVYTWKDLAKVWAARTDTAGGERLDAAAVGASLLALFLVRYSGVTASVTSKDRLVADGVTFDITNVRRGFSKDIVELYASARND